MMTNKKISYQKLLLVFFGSLVVTFLFLYIVISPIVQDAYNKGYERGVVESCPAVLEKMSQNSQVPFYVDILNLSKPAGNQS